MNWPLNWTRLSRVAMKNFNDWLKGDGWWRQEPEDVPRVIGKLDDRVKRLRVIGNGQVPQCAALAWRTLTR